MEQQGLNEVIALYRNSVRESPALMMETVGVDSNRGVTSRGNSPYDKYASPETRAKVLESRMQEIAAFAQSRKIPVSNLYALAEAAMRTGKIPDLGQYGLAGDDAVATKQFMLSNVLNIAGLEWTDYKGDPVEVDPIEADPVVEADDRAREAAAEAAERAARQKKLAARRASQRTTGGFQMSDSGADPSRYMSEGTEGLRKGTQFHTGEYGGTLGGRPGSGRISKAQMKVGKAKRRQAGKAAAETGMFDYEAGKKQQDDVGFDPSRYMSEEGGPYRTGGAPESANSSPAMTSSGGDNPDKLQDYEKKDLLPKKVMDELRKQVGDGVYGYTREDLFRLARERGLLGTEEDIQVEHDYQGAAAKHGGKFVKYIQGNIGIYQFPSEGSAQQFAEGCSAKTTATPKVKGSTVFIDEPTLGEADGIVGSSTDSVAAGSEFNGRNPTQYDVEDQLLKKRPKKPVMSDVDLDSEAYEKSLRERSETDKILGILPDDPRGEVWPKLGDEMARLLNLENCGVFRGPRGINPEGYPEAEPIQEMTTSAGMGGFIGGGMIGSGMVGRTCAMPSYDASYNLPEDPDERVKVLKKMLSKHGLKPAQEGEEKVAALEEGLAREKLKIQQMAEQGLYPAPRSMTTPVVRDAAYDDHPSRFMKRR